MITKALLLSWCSSICIDDMSRNACGRKFSFSFFLYTFYLDLLQTLVRIIVDEEGRRREEVRGEREREKRKNERKGRREKKKEDKIKKEEKD